MHSAQGEIARLAMQQNQNNSSRAARWLGVSIKHMWNMRKAHGIGADGRSSSSSIENRLMLQGRYKGSNTEEGDRLFGKWVRMLCEIKEVEKALIEVEKNEK